MKQAIHDQTTNAASGFVFNDGGRVAAGYRGTTGDCGARALAIAAEIPYQQAYDMLNAAAANERTGKRKRGKSNARTGVYSQTFRRVAQSLGFIWIPTMQIGSGCTVHLRGDELPPGRIICNVSKHYCAVVDGVIHDAYDPSRRGTRCVYGYFKKPENILLTH